MSAAKTVDEPRYLVIGKTDEKHWSAVITYREETIRLISVSRAASRGHLLFEEEKNLHLLRIKGDS